MRGTWVESYLQAIVHGADIPAEIRPVVPGEPVSDPLGIVAGFPDCRRLPLVVEQYCPLGCYRSLEFGNGSFKPAWGLPPSLAKVVHGRVVNGDMGVVPSSLALDVGQSLRGS